MRAQTFRASTRIAIILLAITVLGGCSSDESDLVKSDLSGFYDGYFKCCQLRDKAPASLEELKPFVTSCTFPEELKQAEEEAFRRVLEGKYEIMMNVPLYGGSGKSLTDGGCVVAYEKRSGLAVLGNGRVTKLSADELQKKIANTKAAIQALRN